MLASGFGTAHHHAFVALKHAIDAMIATATEIHVTCPMGTDFSGPGLDVQPVAAQDVSIQRFPMSVFSPIPAGGYSGRVALAGFLLGTGSTYYDPYGKVLKHVLFAHFEAGRLVRFEGDAEDEARANSHYDYVAQTYRLDRNCVHSWHAGIHPGCSFAQSATGDFARWSGSAFGNPRVMHFHTCGNFAPGEISWNTIDPTIRVDGVEVWQDGRLIPERVPGGAKILADYPCAAALFRDPAREIGIAREELTLPLRAQR
jgi:hypothetical protein